MRLKNSIVLVGMMGAGKTTIGHELSNILSVPFYDLDDEIELSQKKTIRDIFEQEGEDAFRHAEHLVLKDVLKKPAGIIATGGGIVTRKVNRDILKRHRSVIYLRATKETLVERLVLGKAHRPLLDGDWEDRLARLLENRKGFYTDVADYIIDVDTKDKATIIHEIQLLNDAFLWYDECD